MNFLAQQAKRFPRATIVAVLSVFMLALAATAGSLTPPAPPASTFHTLEQIYDAIASDSFDSSSFSATSSGSLINHLRYIEQNLGWASVSNDLYYTGSGNVGIGDTTPEVKFEVVGVASVSQLYLGGTLVSSFGVSSNSIDWDEIVDAMTLDADTTINNNGHSFTITNASISNDLEVAGAASISESLDLTTVNPTLVGVLSGSGAPTYLDTAQSIDVQGNYAYVVSLIDGRLVVIDITNPASPTFEGSITVGTGNQPDKVRVQGNYAYAIAQGGGNDDFFVYDISDPTNPHSVATLTNVGSSPGALELAGPYAYLHSSGALRVIDISDPTNPAVISTLTLTGTGVGRSIGIQGRYLYLPRGTSDRVDVINVTDPYNPTVAGSILDGGSALLDNATYLDVQGKYAYVTASIFDNVLTILDISDPTSPTWVSSLSGFSSPQDVYVSGRYAYVAEFGADALTIVDVSDANNPVEVGQISGVANSLDGATEVFVSGQYAYVITNNSDSLTIIDIGGIDTPGLYADDIRAGTLEVIQDFRVGNNLLVGGSLLVGAPGLTVNGFAGFSSDSYFKANASVSGNFEVDGVLYADGGCVGCGGVTSNSLDFDEFVDAMTLDATTSVSFGTRDYIFDIDNSGQFIIKDAGSTFATFASSGWLQLGEALTEQGTVSGPDSRLPYLTIQKTFGSLASGSYASQFQAISLANNSVSAGEFTATTDPSNSSNLTVTTTGLSGTANHLGTGTAAELVGIQGGAYDRGEAGLGNVTLVMGLRGSGGMAASSDSTVTNAVGVVGRNSIIAGRASSSFALWAQRPFVTGTVINNVGLLVDNIAGGTNNINVLISSSSSATSVSVSPPPGDWSIYNASTRPNFFGAGVSFSGNLDPTADDTYDLGEDALRWRDLYLGPGTLDIGTAGNSSSISYNTTLDALQFGVAGNEILTIASNGFIGIATTSPQAPLDISLNGSRSLRFGSGNTETPSTGSVPSGYRLLVYGNGGAHPVGLVNDATFGAGILLNGSTVLDINSLKLFYGGLNRNAQNTAIALYSNVSQKILFQPGGGSTANNNYSGVFDNITGYFGLTNISSISPDTMLDVQGTASISHLLITNEANFAVGGAATVSYSRFGTGTTGHSLSAADDLLITGLVEFDDFAFFDSGASVAGNFEVAGYVTSPGSGTNSEKFGFGTVASGADTVAFGRNAFAGGNGGIVIGEGASSSFTDIVLIGNDSNPTGLALGGNMTIVGSNITFSTTNGTNSVTIGNAAMGSADAVVIGSLAQILGGASGQETVVIGGSANVSGATAIAIGGNSEANTNSLALGSGAIASGSGNTLMAIGKAAVATSVNAIAIGHGAESRYNSSIVMGTNAHATAGGQFIVGDDGREITDLYFGDGVSSSTPVEYTMHGTGAAGTDISGGNLVLAGGRGTGLGLGGDIAFRVAPRTTTGSSLNALSTVMTITGSESVGIGTITPVFELTVASVGEGNIMRLTDADGTCDLDPDSGGLTTSCSSDIRLKSSIEDAPTVLSGLMAFKIREYTVNASGNRTIGVIAQEVQETHPELVAANSDGILMVRQPGIWEMIKGIQELQEQLDELSLPMPAEELSGGDVDVIIARLGGQESVIERIIGALEDGIVRIGILVANLIQADEVQTERLCVGATCVTEQEFQQLLQQNDIEDSGPAFSPEPDPSTTDVAEEPADTAIEDTGDSTEESIEEPKEPNDEGAVDDADETEEIEIMQQPEGIENEELVNENEDISTQNTEESSTESTGKEDGGSEQPL